jgi:hypothetical protein
MANAMLSIEIYQFNGTWCFTDLERKLVHEPFVLGIPEIINTVLQNNSLYEDGKNYRVLFADQEFPKSHGAYQWNDEEGWLCPATLAFFDDFPSEIHFRFEKL